MPQPAVAEVEAQPVGEVAHGADLRTFDGGRALVDEHHRAEVVAVGLELAGHLERNPRAGAVTADGVRAMRLHRLHLGDVVRGHVLDAGVRGQGAVEALRLEAVERLVGRELVAEVGELEDADEVRRHVEERRLRPRRLDRDQRRPLAVTNLARRPRPAPRSSASRTAPRAERRPVRLLDEREGRASPAASGRRGRRSSVDADRWAGRARSPRCRPAWPRARRAGSMRRLVGQRRASGRGSALRSILPFGVSGKRSERSRRRRNHVVGKRLAERSAAACSLTLGVRARDDVGDEPRVAAVRRRTHHGRLRATPGWRRSDVLDLAQLDADSRAP